MKVYVIIIFILTVFLSGSCNNEKQSEDSQIDQFANTLNSGTIHKKDSIVVINECSSKRFTSVLEENYNLDSNAFILTINSKDKKERQVLKLDLPTGRSSIDYCTEQYVAIGSACGGPCYGHCFVFYDKNRPKKSFNYTKRVYLHDNLIAHIRNEEFDKLIIYNFDNNKEIIVDIGDCEQLKTGPWCIDSIFVNKNNKLVLEYDLGAERPKRKIVNIKNILR